MEKYFVYAPEFNGLETFKTKEDAEKAYEQLIEEERLEAFSEGEWLSCCEDIYMGKFTHKAALVNVQGDRSELKSLEII